MITDTYSKMTSDIGTLSMLGIVGGDRDIDELRLQEVGYCERELSILRSGSAPLTVEGQIGAVGGGSGDGGGVNNLNSILEENVRSDPAYISYCYSNRNTNTLLSKEDRPLVERMQGGGGSGGSLAVGGIGDGRKVNRGNGGGGGENGSCDTSLFSMQPAFGPPGTQEENAKETPKEWGEDRLIRLPVLETGSRKKSFAEIIQDDTGHSSVSTHPSRSASRVFDTVVAPSESQFTQLHELASVEALRADKSGQGMSTFHNTGSSAPHTYDAVLGDSLPGSNTPDPQLGVKAPSPHIPPVGIRVNSLGRRNDNLPNTFHAVHPDMGQHANLVSALSGMRLSGVNTMMDEIKHPTSQVYEMDEGLYFQGLQNANNRHSCLTKPVHSYLKGPSSPNLGRTSSPSCYSNIGSLNSSFPNYVLGGCAINPTSPSTLENELGSGNFSPLFENTSSRTAMGASRVDSRAFGRRLMLGPNLFAAAAEAQRLGRMENLNSGGSIQMPLVDPVHLDYFRSIEFAAAQPAIRNDQIINREALACSYRELIGLHKTYPGMFSSQKSQHGLRSVDKTGGVNQGYFVSPSFGPGMSYPGGRLRGPLLPSSPIGAGNYVWHGEQDMHFPSEIRNSSFGVTGSWYSESSRNLDESFVPSFPDDFKNEKTKGLELGEIAGIVVDFSVDQFGSRFIQQKLETATIEEKDMVFQEIRPKALSLMTDVFGNYVIQKFLEHGSAAQIRELGDQLIGHVLDLSLQMYGCRVIQKAIQVVELDQKIKMVVELDGHVMRCVRDQNGNHVIQKCIECVPENAIEFIVATFYDQVVALSTHPYGCRVIQRVLENCHSPKTQSILMTEILNSVCMLAQDQYGNYVVQHLLQHGNPHERSTIINKLGMQIVQMSQQKYASNVVEKCLTYGTPEERKILVNQMLGSSDENEPLQVMMKDQFGNYVVQKVLEICDDQQLELILNRVKFHLDTLKKFTYGKHIVARVEKLVAAGERRIGILNYA